MLIRAITLGIAIAATMWLLAGCDDASPQVGVTLSSNGEPTIVYRPCHESTKVFDVFLLDIQSGLKSVPLWHVQSAAGSSARLFEVGTTPDGFAEIQALTQRVPDDVAVIIATQRDGRFKDSADGATFRTSELRTDRIFVPSKGHMSAEEFQRAKKCS